MCQCDDNVIVYVLW